MSICRKCGIPFEKWRPGGNYKYCPDCGMENAKKHGAASRYQGLIISRMKPSLDMSGNLKSWKAGESLDGLPGDLQERIKKGIDFGI